MSWWAWHLPKQHCQTRRKTQRKRNKENRGPGATVVSIRHRLVTLQDPCFCSLGYLIRSFLFFLFVMRKMTLPQSSATSVDGPYRLWISWKHLLIWLGLLILSHTLPVKTGHFWEVTRTLLITTWGQQEHTKGSGLGCGHPSYRLTGNRHCKPKPLFCRL